MWYLSRDLKHLPGLAVGDELGYPAMQPIVAVLGQERVVAVGLKFTVAVVLPHGHEAVPAVVDQMQGLVGRLLVAGARGEGGIADSVVGRLDPAVAAVDVDYLVGSVVGATLVQVPRAPVGMRSNGWVAAGWVLAGSRRPISSASS